MQQKLFAKQTTYQWGKLLREYIAGKRKSYYKPVAFFILATAVYLILRVWIKFDPLEGEFTKGQTDLAEISTKGEEVFRSMEDNINYILFFLVFSIAFNFKLFFKKEYNLAEYTSIGLFITGLYTLMKIITMFFGKFASAEVDNIEIGILLLLIFYSSFSLFQKKRLVILSGMCWSVFPVLFCTLSLDLDSFS